MLGGGRGSMIADWGGGQTHVRDGLTQATAAGVARSGHTPCPAQVRHGSVSQALGRDPDLKLAATYFHLAGEFTPESRGRGAQSKFHQQATKISCKISVVSWPLTEEAIKWETQRDGHRVPAHHHRPDVSVFATGSTTKSGRHQFAETTSAT